MTTPNLPRVPLPGALLAAALMLAPMSARAQSTPPAAPEQDAQVWLVGTLNGHLTPLWRYYGEVQPRFDVVPLRVNTLALRAAGGYQLTQAVSLWLGYVWMPTFFRTFRDEQRIYQQLLVESGVGPVRLSNRTRLEERFLGGTRGPSLRARHQVRGVLPLGGGWALAASEELFAHLNTVEAGPQAGLDQSRLLVGVDRQLSELLTLEGGYMFHYVWRPTAPSNRIDHNLVVTLAFKLP